jgi:endonuclease/exonuclease/phosphatase family metal-dependent hydrolase
MFTLMTWNVENFFSPSAGADAAAKQAFEQKVEALKAVIIGQAPDIVALQEVGDAEAFESLRAALDADWVGVLSTHFEPSHAIRVGWLSPRPLADVEEVTELPAALSPVKVDDDGTTITAMGRGAVAVTVTTADATAVRVLTTHLKSKLLTFPGGVFSTTDEDLRARYDVYALDRRAAEAATVRDWATQQLAGSWDDKPLAVCGDLNDTTEAATTQLLFGPPGSQYGTGGYGISDRGDRQRLWDTGYAMAAPDNFSRITDGRRELIDHILASHALIQTFKEAATVDLDVPSVGATPRMTPRVDPPSDHRPVVAHFNL